MDLQKFVDGFELTTCIISVERFPDGSYGTIRIVAGNKAYIDSIEDPRNGAAAHMLDNKFIPGSPYERYIPKDLNFEQTCYRCAFLKRPVHTYLKPERFACWIDQYIMPVASDDPNIGYCSYTLDITMEADTELMTDLSASTASNVLQACIKLRGTDDHQKALNDVIADIAKLCSAKRCCLLLADHSAQSCSVIADAVLPGTEGDVQDLPMGPEFYDIVRTWDDTIAGSNCLIIQSPQDMEILKERDPAWYSSLAGSGIDTLVLFPLRSGNETIGYIWAVDFDPSKAQSIKDTLELTTYFIASEIVNMKLLRRLEFMSSMDLLTGIYNRNAMNARVDRYISGTEPVPKSYGVIFADLNGLKTVNDIEGHGAGDELLKRAASRLKDVFSGCEIYRAGGDEFMIFAPMMTEDSLTERIAALRADPQGISFAVGMYYEAGGGDIRNAMHISDERMYADKERYYAEHPERKRK